MFIQSLLIATALLTLSLSALANPSQPSPVSPSQSQSQSETEAKVNINQADANTLANRLSGIGLSKAQAIVAYRQQHGNFKHPQELVLVKGIGMSILEKNKHLIEL
ncbi:ComEA family DNA-binding protein [Paraferrimonas haliotis]|uniref:Competence protein ComEA n=1 Tax=Paraferrimonas haliotis TaxID=2013866 RepID=A0AA37TW11_9GAMM|nr:ComEA family DNA-binding protein [Paraferrimonas haliotis]GLS83845.1 hypothetical protein GCM10007894_18220 [Paraferrimonas haliotis]GLS83972.1 hypothetical protein GCM10007894_19490 [Paraferrimonas haliotis]